MFRFILSILLIILSFNAHAMILIRDDEAETVIKEITGPIFKVAGLTPSSVSINLINDDDPNAFVMGGQNIFISTGLLKFSDNPEILAGILAHETGHIIGGHLVQHTKEMKNLQSKMLLGLLAGALVGAATKSTDAAIGTITSAESMSVGGMMSFSRAQESAADSTSARIMKKLGVGSSGLVEFLHSLSTNERTFYGNIAVYQRTHPLSAHRIDFLKANSLQSSQGSYLTSDLRDRFKMVRAKIIGFTASPAEIMREYGTGDSKPALYARSISYFREQNRKLAIDELNKLIALEPKSPYIFELKGQILFELGQIDESIAYYHKAYNLKPSSDIITMEYASTLIANNKNPNMVLKLLQQVLSHKRDEAYAWHLLGKTYKNLSDEANMHIAFAFESYLKGDLTTAQKQINTVKNKALSDEAKRKLRDIENLVKAAVIAAEG